MKTLLVLMLVSMSVMAYDDYPSMEQQMRDSQRDSDERLNRIEQQYEERKQTRLMQKQLDLERQRPIVEPLNMYDRYRY